MGISLMIQADDEKKIVELQEKLGARTKLEVIRAGLRLLEVESQKQNQILRWKISARLAASESARVNREVRSAAKARKA